MHAFPPLEFISIGFQNNLLLFQTFNLQKKLFEYKINSPSIRTMQIN